MPIDVKSTLVITITKIVSLLILTQETIGFLYINNNYYTDTTSMKHTKHLPILCSLMGKNEQTCARPAIPGPLEYMETEARRTELHAKEAASSTPPSLAQGEEETLPFF